MALVELARELEASLRATSEVLRTLLRGLQQRRYDWSSARPSVLAPSAELERHAAVLQGAERSRATLLERLAHVLPREVGVEPADLHVAVTSLVAALPRDAGLRLRAAADQATALARSVRGEVAFGERLLRSTAAAQEAMLGELVAPAARGGPPAGYDHRARARGALGAAGARLVDGRV
jgi:hypothetical protein